MVKKIDLITTVALVALFGCHPCDNCPKHETIVLGKRIDFCIPHNLYFEQVSIYYYTPLLPHLRYRYRNPDSSIVLNFYFPLLDSPYREKNKSIETIFESVHRSASKQTADVKEEVTLQRINGRQFVRGREKYKSLYCIDKLYTNINDKYLVVSLENLKYGSNEKYYDLLVDSIFLSIQIRSY